MPSQIISCFGSPLGTDVLPVAPFPQILKRWKETGTAGMRQLLCKTDCVDCMPCNAYDAFMIELESTNEDPRTSEAQRLRRGT